MKKKDKIKYPLVLVEWMDAEAGTAWEDDVQTKTWADKDCIIVEIGWVIFKNDKYTVICSQFGKEGDWGNKTKIPTGWIKKTQKIKV